MKLTRRKFAVLAVSALSGYSVSGCGTTIPLSPTDEPIAETPKLNVAVTTSVLPISGKASRDMTLKDLFVEAGYAVTALYGRGSTTAARIVLNGDPNWWILINGRLYGIGGGGLSLFMPGVSLKQNSVWEIRK